MVYRGSIIKVRMGQLVQFLKEKPFVTIAVKL